MATSMHYGARKETFQFASILRKNPTEAEKLLWTCISNKLTGYKFRRQHPTWRYVTDFYCHELRFVIEVDGSVHLCEEIKQNDADREANLCSFGLKIIRFTNNEVLSDIDTVIDKIESKILELKSQIDLCAEMYNEDVINALITRLENSISSTVLNQEM